jgi:hypothetical protein
MENENWRASAAIGYDVSDEGNVRNHITGKLLKQINKDTNLYVNCMIDGHTQYYAVHRLVAEAFVPNPNNYPVAYHKSTDFYNNRPSNIAWGTRKEAAQKRNKYRYTGSCITALTLGGLWIGTYASVSQAASETNTTATAVRHAVSRHHVTANELQFAYTGRIIDKEVRLFKCHQCGKLHTKDGFYKIPEVVMHGKFRCYKEAPICIDCLDLNKRFKMAYELYVDARTSYESMMMLVDEYKAIDSQVYKTIKINGEAFTCS